SRLILLFGHGSPGMTCSLTADAFRDIKLENDIIMCGSCFSSTPMQSDLLVSSNGNRPESLAFRAIDNGAQVFYGHMHENGGFPQLFVAFESLMKGETVGQSYQEVMNTVLATSEVPQNQLNMSDEQLFDKQAVDARNKLMLVMIGDPASRPINRSSSH